MEEKSTHSFTITMEKIDDNMQFKTVFDKNYPDLFFDETPKSGGEDRYPNAVRILTSSVMNCLSASLVFCLKKSRIPMDCFTIKTTATTTTQRNDKNRIRVKQVDVKIEPVFDSNTSYNIDDFKKKVERCSKIYEDYCVVTQSVREGIEVNTELIL